jgi:hypothetical protein
VSHRHHDAGLGATGDFDLGRQRRLDDRERVVSGRDERIGLAGEHAEAGVVHLRHLPV